jgi:DNA-binding MarR family transcriptional regulator
VNHTQIPFSLRDIPTLEEIDRQAHRLGVDLPAIPIRALLRLLRVGNDVEASLARHLHRAGLSMARFEMLSLLMRADQHRLTPSDLAKRGGITRATVTGLVDGLEAKGWVQRSAHPSDRRSFIVELTGKGIDFVSALLPGHVHHILALVAGVAESDLLQLLQTLDRVEANLDDSANE